VRQVLALERTTPEPGPDADLHEHVLTAAVDLDVAVTDAVFLLGGVATVWRLEVDGVEVAAGRSAFEAHTVDLGELAAGHHEVRLRCLPLAAVLDEVPRRPRARWRTALVDEPRLRWLRTPVLGRAPGFAPGPPAVGPVRPVVLVTGETLRLTDLALVAGIDDEGTGVLDVELVATGPDEVLTVEVSGPSGTAHRDVRLESGSARVRLELPGVALWWPHTHGAPTLYDVRVLRAGDPLPLPGDGTGDPDRRRVGFRRLVDDRPGSVSLRVNRVPVFVRGAVWTPGDLAALDEAVTLGLNLVRVSGIAGYESDAFHARCDELGLLVWQDLALVTFDYPLADDDFRAHLEAEVAAQAARLLGHPSTVVVCGSAEHEQQAAMFGVRPDTGAARELAALTRPVVEASGLDATWVDSSPSGGDPVVRVDVGVAQYFGVGAYLRDLPDVRHAGVLFAAECLAFSNLPDGPDPGTGVPRDNGADWDFADVRRHYRDLRHGPGGATSEQEQRVTGEVMAEVFGEWRRPGSPCAGGIVLWLRDLEPGAGWGLLDHTGRPKPAARALAPALQPTAVWLVDEGLNGLDVHVAHDGPEPLDAVLRVALVRADGSVVDEAEVAWSLPGHGHRSDSVDALLGRWADASYAYRFGPAPHAAVEAVLRGSWGTRTARWVVARP